MRCSRSGSIPDLIDDVTKGCLEALARESLRGDRLFDAEVKKVLGRIRTRRRIATTVFPWQG